MSVEKPVLPLRPGREAELLEQDPADLLRRAEHELLAGEVVGPRLELLDHLAQPRRDLAHPVLVDLHPGVFHRGEDRRQRELDVAVERLHAALAHALEEQVAQPERRRGVADERSGLLLGGRVRLELEPVLGCELVQRVLGARRLDQVREEQRVVLRRDALRLGVVDDQLALEPLRPRRDDDALRNGDRDPLVLGRDRHLCLLVTECY